MFFFSCLSVLMQAQCECWQVCMPSLGESQDGQSREEKCKPNNFRSYSVINPGNPSLMFHEEE